MSQNLQNTFFIDDNLNVMSRIPSNSIDLIATDPPFNTAKFRQTKKTKYSDIWTMGEVFAGLLESKLQDSVIEETKKLQLQTLLQLMGDKKSAERTFVVFMMLRALEMHRVLKDQASLYWQCDPTMSHALKLMLDIIFGKENFINEIVWAYKSGGASDKYFSKKHDTILFYAKSKNYIFNIYKEKSYNRGYKRYGFKDVKEYQDKCGWYTLVNQKDVLNIDMVGRTSGERVGYPTQKPLKLFEAFIRASANKNAIVLDPFCGCATTCVAVLRLNEEQGFNRKFMGIDVNATAMRAMQYRLDHEIKQGSINETASNDVHYIVNKQLLVDSITDINNLIRKTTDKINALGKKPKLHVASISKKDKDIFKKFEDLESDLSRLQTDRDFLQKQLTVGYTSTIDYLGEIKTPHLKEEVELNSVQKGAWKSEQLEKHRIQGNKYNCKGYDYRGRQIRCRTKLKTGSYPLATTKNIEIDRIIPATMGGKYTKSNIQAICNECNADKSSKY